MTTGHQEPNAPGGLLYGHQTPEPSQPWNWVFGLAWTVGGANLLTLPQPLARALPQKPGFPTPGHNRPILTKANTNMPSLS